MSRLYLARYGIFGSDNTWKETIEAPVDLRVSCELPFWMQKMEFTVTPRSIADEAKRRNTHHGHQWILFDDRGRVLTHLHTRQTMPDNEGVRYICTRRSGNGKYTTQPTPTNDVPTTLAAVVNGLMSALVNTVDQTNDFDANTTQILQWRQREWDALGNGPEDGGISLEDAVDDLLSMSDSSYDVYDFWIEPGQLDHLTPQKGTAYYRKRDTTGRGWVLTRSDMAELSLSSDIFNVANTVTVHYSFYTGTHTGSSNVANLTDSGATFTDGHDKVEPGDMVYNLTDGSQGSVITVVSDTELEVELSGGTDDDFDNGDVYGIEFQDPEGRSVSATATAAYWAAELIEYAPDLNRTQATQLANMLLARYNDKYLRASFTVGAPEILHRSGAMLPQWYLLRRPTNILIHDLEPSAVSFDTFLDNESSFWPVRVDFDYASMRTRIVPNDPNDFDTLLARAGVTPGGRSIYA